MMETAVGQGTTEALMEEEKQQSHLDALAGEPIGVTRPSPFQQGVAFQLAKIVAQLIQTVDISGDARALLPGKLGSQDQRPVVMTRLL
jgi:hypothetical protein